MNQAFSPHSAAPSVPLASVADPGQSEPPLPLRPIAAPVPALASSVPAASLPADAPTGAIGAALGGAPVVVLGQGSEDAAFLQALRGSADSAGEGLDGGLGLVVIDWTPEKISSLRDVAEDIQRAGLEGGVAVPGTLVVRSPGGVGAVSDTYPRSSLDEAATAMAKLADYPASIEAFAAELDQPSGSSVAVAVGGSVVAMVLIFVAAAGSTRKALRRGQGN